MNETVRKRRRWPWVVLAVVLLLIGGPIGWQLRPLTATERQLVGRWGPSTGVVMYHFRADRRFSIQDFGGTWHVSSGSIIFHQDPTDTAGYSPIVRAKIYVQRILNSTSYPLRFDGPNQITLNKMPLTAFRNGTDR